MGLKMYIHQVHPTTLAMEEKSLLDGSHMLIMTKSNDVTFDRFKMEYLDFIINSIASQ